jgi:hypothetical protein
VAGALKRLRVARHDKARRSLAETYAPRFRDHQIVQAALRAGEPGPAGAAPMAEGGWPATFFDAAPAAVAAAVKEVAFSEFFEHARARRWIEVHARIGDLARLSAFLDAYLPLTADHPRRLAAIAGAIVKNGKTLGHFQIADRLFGLAGELSPDGAGRLALTTRLAVNGAVRLNADFFTSAVGALQDGSWRLQAPSAAAEVLRSLPVELPQGRFRLRLDLAGARTARRWLMPDVIDRKNRSFLSRAGRLANRLTAAGFGFGEEAVTIEIPDLSHRREARLYIRVRSRRRREASALEFQGVELRRA